jgi:hypothetical protein
MRLFYVFLILMIACSGSEQRIKSDSYLSRLNEIPNIKIFHGDSIFIQLTPDEVGESPNKQIQFTSLDNEFYNHYSLGSQGFEALNTSHVGGPSSYQFYYGQIESRNPQYRQILILQIYNFNDTVNSLFLLTFNESDSLISAVEVASLIYQAEVKPVFSSLLYTNRLVKYEITTSRIPDNIEIDTTGGSTIVHEPSDTLFLFCKDSIRKEFGFNEGNYVLLKKDSVRPCVWKNDW